MVFEIGTQIGPYKLIEIIGQGGMATVYKAYHEALDRFVAIKALNPIFLDDPSFLKRFQREAKVVAKFDQANIVPIYDFSEYEGRPYLVMKLIEGETLKDRIKKGKLSSEEICKVITAVGNALAYAHNRDILHRDIKPSNVLMATDGQIYLADFGLARLVQAGESTLTSDRLLGTPKYISPEQAMSKPEIDARADIYSFGAMVYELLVGRVPFLADTPYTIIHDHIYTPLPPPQEINPDLSDEIAYILIKSLEKKPEDRYQHVTDFVNEINVILSNKKDFNTNTSFLKNKNENLGELIFKDENVPLIGNHQNESIKEFSENKITKKKFRFTKKSCIWIPLIVIVLIGTIIGCLALLGMVFERVDQNKLVTHPNNEIFSDADVYLEKAYENFKNNDYPEMEENLRIVKQMVDSSPDYYFDSIKQLEEKEENLFALIVALSYAKEIPIEDLEKSHLDKLHELLYKASIDDNIEVFLRNNERLANIGNIAILRFRLYHSGEIENVKNELGGILNNPILLRRFPEAKLLEVEVFISINDYNIARQLSDEILNEPPGKIPEWIIIELNKLMKELN
ncbi:MAG: hypothetical protein CL609_22965 [Anaerolineaceae bacterium]|nr:hypothetical protein [Anaerolineaceae bacterium]